MGRLAQAAENRRWKRAQRELSRDFNSVMDDEIMHRTYRRAGWADAEIDARAAQGGGSTVAQHRADMRRVFSFGHPDVWWNDGNDRLTSEQMAAARQRAQVIADRRDHLGQPPIIAASEIAVGDVLLVDVEPAQVLHVQPNAHGQLLVTLADLDATETGAPARKLACEPTHQTTRLSTKRERDRWVSQPPDAGGDR